MIPACDLSTQSEITRLIDDYDAIVRRFADDNGVLPPDKAVDAAEIAHRLHLIHTEESEHWQRLSREHREGK